MGYIVCVFGIPCISMLILWALDRPVFHSFIKLILTYASFTVLIRFLVQEPIYLASKACGREFTDQSGDYMLYGIICAVLLALIYVVIDRYVKVSIDEKKR